MLASLLSLPHRKAVFAEGQYLFRVDDPVQSMHLIEAGSVHLVRTQKNGGQLVLQRSGAGSILAEASLFVRSYHCDARACEPTTAVLIARSAMHRRFQQDPDFAQEWTSHLSDEVRRARRRAEILSLRTVSERLDAWLAENGPLPEKGSWRIMASELGVSSEALYREIARRRN